MSITDKKAVANVLWGKKDPAKNSFVAYKNYLLGINYLIENLYPSYSDLQNSVKKTAYKTTGSSDPIRKLLFNAWNTEILLHLPPTFTKELTKYSNHWSPVQSYYSVYLAIRALFLAKDKVVEEKHRNTLSTMVSFILDEKLFPPPWNLVFGQEGFSNLPHIEDEDVSVLNNPYFFKTDVNKLWNFPRIFVRRTRERAVEKACEVWKKENPKPRGGVYKKLPKGRLEQIEKKVRKYTLFDCMYRLRLRSNYEDADIFMSGINDYEAENYIRALCGITDKTLFIIEVYIASMIGTTKMREFIDEYKKRHQKTTELLGSEIGIFRREKYIQNETH